MKIKQFTLGVATTNCYLVEIGEVLILIDPVIKSQDIDEAIGERKLNAILLTHGHFDHTFGCQHYFEKYQAPVFIHRNDAICLTDNDANLSSLFGVSGHIQNVDPILLSDKKNTLHIDGVDVEYGLYPGHSRGEVVYSFVKQNVIFVGDLVFLGSIGRYDLPRCSEKDMKKSIRTFFANEEWQKKNPVLYPGHGPKTTFQSELQSNQMVHLILEEEVSNA